MKKFKKFFVILLTLVLVLSTVNINEVSASSIRLNKSNLTLDIGKSSTLKVSGTSKKITWISSNKSVATVTQKGKVTGKMSGSATITAKVSGKSLNCKVKVVEKFSAKKATKNIAVTLKDTGKGVVAILKNKNKIPVSISATLVFKNNSNMIGSRQGSNYCLESGKECTIFFIPPTDENYEYKQYDDYKITLNVTESSKYMYYATDSIKVVDNSDNTCVTAEVTNNYKKEFEFIHLSIIYYDENNNAIGWDERYAECEQSGSVDYITFEYPYDSSYNTIIPTSYKIYVDFAYNYSY